MMDLITTALTTLSNPMYAIILALAVYSITRLLYKDSFPPIEKARNWFFDRFPHDGYSTLKRPVRGQWITMGSGYHVNIGVWQGELLSCPWCLGWWVSLVGSVLFLFWPLPVIALCVPFALRVIPGIIESVID